MKAFLVLLVLLGIGYYYYFYRPSANSASGLAKPSDSTGASTSAAAPAKQGFEKLTALLNQDMQGIPAPLDGPGRPPTNAVAIRRGLTSHESARPEYQTLAKACDLILQADAQRASLQQACHTEQTRASFGSTLNGNSSLDHAVSTRSTQGETARLQSAAQTAIHNKYETSWNSYRGQTAGQVQSLLGSLANKQL